MLDRAGNEKYQHNIYPQAINPLSINELSFEIWDYTFREKYIHLIDLTQNE